MMSQATILIVDDDPLIMNVILQIIARAVAPSARILTAGNGEEGLLKARQTQPDLIITDLMMPRMDGYDMVQSLRQEKMARPAQIIGISIDSPANPRMNAFRVLCDNFLAKPFKPNDLLEKLSCLLSPYQPGDQANLLNAQ